MDWYKNQIKVFSILSLTLLVLTAGALYYGQSNYGKIGDTQVLKDGVSTCFQRVSQTFTALMIGQASSSYLTPSFISNTGDCFTDVNKIFTNEWSQYNGAKQVVNQLVSDTHWFHEKVQKIASLSQTNLDLNNSNIINKYSELEQTRNKLVSFLGSRSENAKSVAEMGVLASMGFFLLLVSVGVGFFVSRLKVVRELFKLEQEAISLESSKQVQEEIDALISKGLKVAGLSQIRQLFLDSRSNLFIPKMDIESMPAPENILHDNSANDNEISASISQSLSHALKGIKDKAFTHGVIVDIDVDDDLYVKAETEDVDQLIFNIVDYAIDASVKHNMGRKISVRTKALGDTAYIKFSVANHCFNATELDHFSGLKSLSDTVGLNLTLIKELISDLNAELNIKNKVGKDTSITAAEFELSFDRTLSPNFEMFEDAWEGSEVVAEKVREENVNASESTEESARIITIVKGKKRDLLRRMNSEF